MSNSIVVLKDYMSKVEVKERLNDMLGKRASAFANSIVNVVTNNSYLQKCTPESIMSAAMKAATFDMPIDPALGFAAIVPYKDKAVFQIMYKGVTQLCIRSGKYKTIQCSKVYADEIRYHNPITGEVAFNDASDYKMRYSEGGKVAGHYAYFKLLSGFEKPDYMTHDEAMAHGKKYSKAYQYDLNKNKHTSCWSTDPDVMCNKTVLLRLLTKYGIMSIDMQDAIIADSADVTFDQAQITSDAKKKNESGKDIVDAEVIPEDNTGNEPEKKTETDGSEDWQNA